MTLLKLFSRRLILALLVSLTLVEGVGSPAQAQAPSWQQSSRGLSVAQNSAKKTAGLAMTVQAQEWPTLSLQGGVKDGGWGMLASSLGIDLGAVKLPGSSSVTLTNETTDWSHNELTFTTDTSAQLKLWVSRLSSAILMQTSSRSLRLLTGNVNGNIFNGTTVTPRPAGPAYPKYVAYSAGGAIRVQALGTSDLALPALDQSWLLVWYGGNSAFVETKKPLSYTEANYSTASLPQKYAYQADAPLLLVFQNAPSMIKQAAEGGLDLTFSNSAGSVAMLPLFGRDHLPSADTEAWAQGLPASVQQKAQWWAGHLCLYPTSVSETYGYDSAADTASITERFSFTPVCSGGTTFAPLPPMLALAKDALHVSVSAPLADGNLPTEFGPLLGVEGMQSYTWRVSGLKKYVESNRILTNTGRAPAQLEQELGVQVDKILAGGHFAPWLFTDSVPQHKVRGDIYWLNPTDVIEQLAEVADVLPVDRRSSLLDYLKTERRTYPPETIYNLPLDQGTTRGSYAVSGQTVFNEWRSRNPAVFLKRVPVYNLFALSRYYGLTDEPIPLDTWHNASSILEASLQEQDWATLYWFKGFEERRVAVVNANRHFAGLIGYVRLAAVMGDSQAETMGRALFAKAAAFKLAMVEYPRYLYTYGLADLPPDPAWQPEQFAGRWDAPIFNYSWIGPSDDHRQVAMLDQFGVYLYDHSGFMEPGTGHRDWETGTTSAHLIAFGDMVPELARFLGDYAKADSEIYINKVEAVFPHWYMAFAEGMLGAEHNLSHPIDSYQIFMAKAWLQHENPDKLARYASFPWLEAGDLFYIHKLAETIKAYRGWAWSDELPGCTNGLLGDVNCDCTVNMTDLQLVASHWQTQVGDANYDARYDLNHDGVISVSDVQLVAAHLGQHC